MNNEAKRIYSILSLFPEFKNRTIVGLGQRASFSHVHSSIQSPYNDLETITAVFGNAVYFDSRCQIKEERQQKDNCSHKGGHSLATIKGKPARKIVGNQLKKEMNEVVHRLVVGNDHYTKIKDAKSLKEKICKKILDRLEDNEVVLWEKEGFLATFEAFKSGKEEMIGCNKLLKIIDFVDSYCKYNAGV